MDNKSNTKISKINESEIFMKYKSSYKSAFLDLSKHTFVLSFAFYLLWFFRNSWVSIFIISFISLMINRTFIVFHDCCHNSYTPNKNLNYFISHITGIFVLTSPNWILDHHTHHLTNGNIENSQHYFFNETVLFTKKQYLSQSIKNQDIYKFYKQPHVFFTIIPSIYFGLAQRFIYILKKFRHPKKYNQSMFTIIFNHVINNIGTLCYLYNLNHYGILWHYLVCFCVSSSISFMVFHNQHSYNPAYVVGNDNWTQKDSGLRGSAFTQIPYYLKYFYMGIEYHHIHHMNAKIPGYNLQSYHEEVISKSDSFDNIHKVSMLDFYNNLWLVLYDEDNKKYITFAELHEDITKNKNN
jgi:omega-6 fatty acid desaturase (delta-12 desaturase)